MYKDALLLDFAFQDIELFTPFLLCSMNVLIKGLAWDHHCYNNYLAVGTQMYPAGIYKYYDLFQLDNYFVFMADAIFVLWCNSFKFMTLGIPLNYWLHFKSAWDQEKVWGETTAIFLLIFCGSWMLNLFEIELDQTGNYAIST